MATRLHRDRQQWFFDWMVKETGRVFHFQPDGRGGLPKSVRRHVMISKHVGREALRFRALAEAEERVGHRESAMEFYLQASSAFAAAQHVIFENTAEKRFLHSSSVRCYDKVREYAPYPIEHVDVPWGDQAVSGNLHLLPDGRRAPCVIFIPGCDMTKEMYPHPYLNHALQRGMHLFSMDGPGQGESNLRGVRLTDHNYEDAASAVIDYLQSREEVDETKIGVYGLSFGSFWALRVAATDHRVRACVAPWATYGDKYYLMNEESPRYKQLFRYLTQAESEEELDEITERMTMRGLMSAIQCPTLLTSGEYDPRSPLEEIYELFDEMTAPAELWVYEDKHHMATLTDLGDGDVATRDVHFMMFDWLNDRFADKPLEQAGQCRYLRLGGAGPYGADAAEGHRWFEVDPQAAAAADGSG